MKHGWNTDMGNRQRIAILQTGTRPDAIPLLSPGNAEACEVALEVRRVPEAKGGTGAVRPVAPGTATKDTAIAGIWASGVVCGGLGIVFRAVPIRAPLPGIPMKVIHAHGLEAARQPM